MLTSAIALTASALMMVMAPLALAATLDAEFVDIEIIIKSNQSHNSYCFLWCSHDDILSEKKIYWNCATIFELITVTVIVEKLYLHKHKQWYQISLKFKLWQKDVDGYFEQN